MKKTKIKSKTLATIKKAIHDSQKEDGAFDGRFSLRVIPNKKKKANNKRVKLKTRNNIK